ncbi:nitrilase family protein-like protein [Delitschia confertaspora ATCC 74209]|uniref:Nitrilase family protein-like protein n=1 Tax=Delitschia confertaspora ATCC 74209 TaxID=1513339 RepID=A0A9P4JVZ6_9PLEO|nr:nitrilase family protein-like protein [Delitschia confertaspora ATCC 74209]
MSSPILKQSLKLALIQLSTTSSKSTNLSHARTKVLEAAKQGAKLVVLPECFNSPYGTKYFSKYAEVLMPKGSKDSEPTKEQSPTFHALRDMAKEAGVWIVGGSIPEREESPGSDSNTGEGKGEEDGTKEKLYNTSLSFSPSGDLVCTHRKIHLFDIDIPGKIRFKESEVLSPGNKISVFDMPEYGKVAVAICYDIRFPELATIAARRGAFLLLYPGAFNLTTGALHWELQGRARAMDNQVFVGLCSPARDMEAEYHAWGHSMVVDPNAEVLGQLEEKEDILVRELEAGRIEEVRKGIPLYTQRRFDVYPDVSQDAKVGTEL